MSRIRLVVTWSVLLLLGGAPLSAQAQQLGALCFGSQSLEFLPALVSSARPVRVSGDGAFSYCMAVERPDVMSATLVVPAFTATLGCGLVEAQTVLSFTWNTGETSTVIATTDVHPTSGLVVIEARGTVVQGLFEGSQAVFTWTAEPPDSLGCETPGGISAYVGPSSLTILHTRRE
ncbi:hypothetical protein LY474_20100 [Myxococcus stipitatus]|uniref:hypothetical protein n=1 Tax=Myxococcus stipitatus TaxID=83455 RepID=UPI001F1E7B40|nr:hypothetical protein [Myxococcus stipitatus]MCE9670104.1 hypothetical protein [Myxococcus stipitatus]